MALTRLLLSALTLLLATPAAAQKSIPAPPEQIVQSVASGNAARSDSTACDTACASLVSKLATKVFIGEAAIVPWWDAKVGELIPACRVEPESADDVATALATVKQHGCHFAVKGGGHNAHPGATNADGGVNIDLRRMNRIDLATDKKSVRLGAGLTWLPVYEKLEKEGLYVRGGRVADVGVAGFLLGGGLNWFTSKQGFGCDSVLEYEIVLPSGKVTTVSQKKHADLYKALRGAGQSNFGIVTEFKLEVFKLPPPGKIWYGERVFSPDKQPAVAAAHNKWVTDTMVSHPSATGQFQIWGYQAQYGGQLIMSQMMDTEHGDVGTLPRAFAHYADIEAINGTEKAAMHTPSEFGLMIEQLSPPGMRNSYVTFCFRPSAALEERLHALFGEALERLKHIDAPFWAVVTQPISAAAMALSSRRGGNALGLEAEGEEGPLVIWHLPWMWLHARDDAHVYEVARELLRKSEDAAKEAGRWHRYKYVNYAAHWQAGEVYEGYGRDNLEWLREVQRRYDPEQVFTRGGLSGGYVKLNEKTGTRQGHARDEL